MRLPIGAGPAGRAGAFARRLGLAVVIWAAAAGAGLAAELTLERVVLVHRHGVRPPTQSAQALQAQSGRPWPVWPVAAGELTPHGAKTIALLGASLRTHYRQAGLLTGAGCADAGMISVWADGADQRTRASGAVLAQTLAPGCGLTADHGPAGRMDPLFDAGSDCPLDAEAARRAVLGAAGPEGLETAASRRALGRLQSIVAPRGCDQGKGVCLRGADQLATSPSGVELKGPLATGSTLAENLLLEYAEGLPPARVGWGAAASAGAIAAVMAAHERAADLMRRTPYIAQRRGVMLARAILAGLNGAPSPYFGPKARLIGFSGHDTNLSNMAGVFGLAWRLPDQPDSTAPATALAFELWRDRRTGERFVRPVLFYQRLEQLRTLTPPSAARLALRFEDCGGPAGVCSLADLTRKIDTRLPGDCPAPPGGPARKLW
jgi:4-phytase/acid phosphatase